MTAIPIKRALVSVSDKAGLAEFVHGLVAAGVEVFSTGGTRKHLEQAGITVRDIADYTGFPEMMDGRLKTLHPKVAGGILGRHDNAEDLASMAEHGIVRFELVVVNLYRFEQTIANPHVSVDEAIEQIDIGGPTMVRAAAKNHAFVAIATDPSQYAEILEEVHKHSGTTFDLRRKLAGAAFEKTARYDRAIANYFAELENPEPFPVSFNLAYDRTDLLRYGENPHQQAALYSARGASAGTVVAAEKLHGKELSYNNLLDLDSAWAIARSIPKAGTVVIKHNNPCGAASADTLHTSARLALDGDPTSAFGSILAFNDTVHAATAEVLVEPGRFIEAVIAPDFDLAAYEILTTRPKWKASVRLLKIGLHPAPATPVQIRQIDGGLLIQQADIEIDSEDDFRVVTTAQPNAAQLAELRFAWAICRHVKSNAIVLCRDQSLVGCGAGQMSRVDSVEIAIHKAGQRAPGSVLASDAFFPFEDSIHRAAAAGVAAIIQPGGSKRDQEVIDACNQHGLPMIFTGRRHFKH